MFSKDNVYVNIIIIIIIIVITSPDWLAPYAALVSQSQGPEELVSLQPARVHVGIELVGEVGLGQVGVEQGDEAGHEDLVPVGEENIAFIFLVNRVVSITRRFTYLQGLIRSHFMSFYVST